MGQIRLRPSGTVPTRPTCTARTRPTVLPGWPHVAAHGLVGPASRSGARACTAAALTTAAFGAAGELGKGAATEEEGGDCGSP
jgi:hypothetical protein